MKTTVVAKTFTFVMMAGAFASHSLLYAQSGYMAFLDPSKTMVTTGDASSYMRAGTDWDGSNSHISGGVAIPTLLQKSTITTWRDTMALHFIFVVPDRTTVQVGNPATTTLACGDQLVVQIGPAPLNPADTQLQSGKEFRFEVVIQNNLITPQPIGSTTTGPVAKRLPNVIGQWKAAAEPSTTANATLTTGGNQYTITLDIPLSEINNPTSDIGLSLAILNDLGNSHNSHTINDASGTGFPLGMGLTPESDPGLTCGAQPAGVTATGNWTNPSTWGTGYFSTATVAGNVTLSQLPQFSLSDAIRIGKCNVTDFATIPAVSASNWISVQQTSPTWYLYNPQGPCRMGIWIKPNVTGTAVVKRRFLVVWGRPGISPQDWYFAGLTDPVALAGPNPPAISFIWNNVNAVPFSDHPCMRVYVLPEDVTDTDPFLTPLETTTGTTQAALDAMEAHFHVAAGSSLSAQMNFANIGTGICTDQQCLPLIGFRQDPGTSNGPRFSIAAPPLPAGFVSNFAQGETTGQAGDQASKQGEGGDKSANLVRIFAHGFAVPEPTGNRRYVYVDPIGSLGWAFPANLFGKGSMSLNMDVTLPKVAAKMFVGGKTVEIPSSPARVHVALVTDALPGTPMPKIDTGSLDQIAKELMTPGQTATTKIGLQPSTAAASTSKFAAFFDFGAGIPNGSFSNVVKTGFSFNGGFEYIFNAHLSAEGILGVHHFPGNVAGDVTAVQFGAGAKVFFNSNPNRVFARAGAAGYHLTSGSTNAGGYFGAGFLHQFNQHLGIEGPVYTFHTINTPVAATQFSTVQAGVRYVF